MSWNKEVPYWHVDHLLVYVGNFKCRGRDQEIFDLHVKNAKAIGWQEKGAIYEAEGIEYWDNILRQYLTDEEITFKPDVLTYTSMLEIDRRQRLIDKLQAEVWAARIALASRHLAGNEGFDNVERKVEKEEEDETSK